MFYDRFYDCMIDLDYMMVHTFKDKSIKGSETSIKKFRSLLRTCITEKILLVIGFQSC